VTLRCFTAEMNLLSHPISCISNIVSWWNAVFHQLRVCVWGGACSMTQVDQLITVSRSTAATSHYAFRSDVVTEFQVNSMNLTLEFIIESCINGSYTFAE